MKYSVLLFTKVTTSIGTGCVKAKSKDARDDAPLCKQFPHCLGNQLSCAFRDGNVPQNLFFCHSKTSNTDRDIVILETPLLPDFPIMSGHQVFGEDKIILLKRK
jgi:hypothetical protein